MPVVRVSSSESFEIALRRSKKQCEKEGILSGVRREELATKTSRQEEKEGFGGQKRARKRIRNPGR